MAVKELNGKELSGFIKERQAKQVQSLLAKGITPKLALVQTIDSPVIDTYVRMKKRYGEDIGIVVDIQKIDQSKLRSTIEQNNNDESVHAMIVQLPLDDPSETDDVLKTVSPHKDVDGLGENPDYEPATATASLWLLAGYNVDLRGKNIAVVGSRGRLVGAPLIKMLESAGHKVVPINSKTEDPSQKVIECEIVIAATGKAGLVTNDWIAPNTVVVDAGTASEGGKVVGDVSDEVRERDDLTALTPLKGGVGPLTVCALFENTIQAASKIQK